MNTPAARIKHFATVWNQFKPSPFVYGLEFGHSEREASVTTTDMLALVEQHEALLASMKALVPFMDIAFAAEGDTFGIYHNDANDALIAAQALLSKIEAR